MLSKKWTKTTLVTLTSLLVLSACGNDPVNQGSDSSITDPADETEELRGESESSDLDDGLGNPDTAEDDTGEADTSNDTSDTAVDPDDSSANEGQGLESQTFATDVEAADQIFRDEFGQDVLVESIRLERDDGRYVYEIDGFDSSNEYELEIDAETEEILSSESQAEHEDNTSIEFEGLISSHEAMDIALSEIESGIVTAWELDVEDGITRYEIEIDDDIEVDVEAYEGTVLEVDN